MKRKSWISLLTGMALLLTAVGNHPGGAVTVKAETATRQAAGHTHDMSVSCGQEQAISFTEWSDPTSMPDTAGNYCLTVDVTLAGDYNAWNVPEGVTNLCLNGHTLTRGQGSYSHVLWLGQGRTLNVCDCDGQGMIKHRVSYPCVRMTNGVFNLYGGTLTCGEYGIEIDTDDGDAVVNMYGGSIREVKWNGGRGVHLDDGVFNMYGGVISDNTNGVSVRGEGVANIQGGRITGNEETGIDVDTSTGEGGAVRLSGNVFCSGNDGPDVCLNVESMDMDADETDPDNPKYYAKDVIYTSMELTGPLQEDQQIMIGFPDIAEWGYEEYWPSQLTVATGKDYRITEEDLQKFRCAEEFSLKNQDNHIQMILNSYPVTFDSQGGSDVAAQTVYHRSKAEQVGNPVRNGYTFTGWYEDKECTRSWDFATPITKAVTLYGGWTANTYTVTYDYQGATGGNETLDTKVSFGSAYGTLPIPEKEGLLFDGWYTDAQGGTRVDSTTLVNQASDHTLYARWATECSHSWEQKSDNKNHWQECILCQKKQEIQAHTEGDGVVTKEPTAMETGLKSYPCSVCGYVMRTETIPAKGMGTAEPPTKTPDGAAKETEPPMKTPDGVVKQTETPKAPESPTRPAENLPAKVQKIMKAYQVSVDTAQRILQMAEEMDVPMELLLTTEAVLTSQKSEDVRGADFGTLRAAVKKRQKKSLTLTWSRVKGADGYKIFGNRCGTKNKFRLLKDVNGKKSSYTCKKIGKRKMKQNTYYKFVVIAYRMVDGKQAPVSAGRTIHAATGGGKLGMALSVRVQKKHVAMKKGKSRRIRAKEVGQSVPLKKHRRLSFESDDTNVATVSRKGVIRARGKGKCKIYVYAQNGVYYAVKVTVK